MTLHLGDWRERLVELDEWDALISDPPYGERVHQGHDAAVADDEARRSLSYSHFTRADVCEFVELLAPRTRGWFCVMTSHDLVPTWEQMLEEHGRYVFAPVPCVIRGMTVRLVGDGPSSWAVWLVVARPRVEPYSKWGTLPGAYVTSRGGGGHIGGKPLGLMQAVVRDYTRPGDLVCDPCAGYATTGVAAESLGRRFVGCEIDEETHKTGADRLTGALQPDMFAEAS